MLPGSEYIYSPSPLEFNKIQRNNEPHVIFFTTLSYKVMLARIDAYSGNKSQIWPNNLAKLTHSHCRQ